MRSPAFSIGGTTLDEGRDEYHFSRKQPTSYRVGECTAMPDGRMKLETTVIWRFVDHNSERIDSVLMAKTNGMWLVDRVDVGAQPGPDF
jgi:hypothetical protein